MVTAGLTAMPQVKEAACIRGVDAAYLNHWLSRYLSPCQGIRLTQFSGTTYSWRAEVAVVKQRIHTQFGWMSGIQRTKAPESTQKPARTSAKTPAPTTAQIPIRTT
jgi:hypothetical protein